MGILPFLGPSFHFCQELLSKVVLKVYGVERKCVFVVWI